MSYLGKAAAAPRMRTRRRSLRGYQCACPPPQGGYRYDPNAMSGLGDTCTIDAGGNRVCTAPTAGPQPGSQTSPNYILSRRRVQVPRLVCSVSSSVPPASGCGSRVWNGQAWVIQDCAAPVRRPMAMMGLGIVPYVNDGFFTRRYPTPPVLGPGNYPQVPGYLGPPTPAPTPSTPPVASPQQQCRIAWDTITVPDFITVPDGFTFYNGQVISIPAALSLAQNQAPAGAQVSVDQAAPSVASSPTPASSSPGMDFSSFSSIFSTMPWYGWAAIAAGGWMLLGRRGR